MFKRNIFYIMISCLLLTLSFGSNTVLAKASTFEENQVSNSSHNALFYQANKYYQDADYEKAVDSYEQILQEGYASGHLYYNLGNTYYRLDQKGKALLNYMRAKNLIPRDPDLSSNLEYLEEELQIERDGGGWLFGLASWISDYMTLRELAFLVSLFLTLVVILILSAVFITKWRQFLKIPMVIVILCLIIFLFGTVLSGYHFYGTNPAVVVVNEAKVRFEPSMSGEIYYSLTEGTTIGIENIRDEWSQIQREDGKKGWVKSEDIEVMKINK
ncbi:MAG: hypothetical protein KAX49_03300 [Halanaerobiales bacterium]|nr:hypothetical protein [Halanaerobiales bacterium]